ncbi:cysteine proteinase [Dacryopinax primogenitus]|uniref:Ubiquitin carboxyl-terminal hydrolase n=1 Tax=Dacryopinax primogenitus (strain DJM 731) TaxID=1858805 RepID=M5GDS3_DACPD|nr:cysteine proteinase [Dacryopinax primogenitus]EJU04777.1 cysteine proteinase [Dacryopinax primogenitus]
MTQAPGCEHFAAACISEDARAGFGEKLRTAALLGSHYLGMDGPPPKKKRRLPAPMCGGCAAPLHRPQLCLECSFLGGWDDGHVKAHLEKTGHLFGIDAKSGMIFCHSCDDFIYSKEMDERFEQVLLAVEEKRTPTQVSQENSIERQKFTSWNEGQHRVQLAGFKSVAGRGRRGLLNLGASCYLSVIVQTFLHNPVLRNYFLSDKHPTRLCKNNKTCICCEMDKLFAEFYSTNTATPYGPTSLMHAMWLTTTELAGYAQQDAHEFYLAALHQIHASSRGSTNVSCNCIIHSTFAGQLQSEVVCGECGNVTTTLDPMLDISLDLKGVAGSKNKHQLGVADENTLGACLRRFTRHEKLPHEYNCSECGKMTNGATKRLSFRKLPPVLAFHFKRFEHSSTATKIDTPIRFPSVINMAPFTSAALGKPEGTIDPDEFGPEVLYDYDLFAVVNHEGKIDTGHYTNFARVDGEWYRYDDDKVVRTTLRACLDSRAYMCFYIKRHFEYRPYSRPSYVEAAKRMELEKAMKKNAKVDKEKSPEKEKHASAGIVKVESASRAASAVPA